VSGAVSRVNVDHAVLERRSRAEAREHLLLIDAQALGSASNRTSALTGLVLGVHGSLDLVARVLQDRNVPAGRRLGESRGRSRQHHGQHRCQQHYLPQLNHLLTMRNPTRSIFSSSTPNVNTIYRIFYYFLKIS
jgi:hypothetical protein